MGVGGLKHIEVRHLFLQQCVEDGTMIIRKVPRDQNPADMLTHPPDVKTLQLFCPRVGLMPQDFAIDPIRKVTQALMPSARSYMTPSKLVQALTLVNSLKFAKGNDVIGDSDIIGDSFMSFGMTTFLVGLIVLLVVTNIGWFYVWWCGLQTKRVDSNSMSTVKEVQTKEIYFVSHLKRSMLNKIHKSRGCKNIDTDVHEYEMCQVCNIPCPFYVTTHGAKLHSSMNCRTIRRKEQTTSFELCPLCNDDYVISVNRWKKNSLRKAILITSNSGWLFFIYLLVYICILLEITPGWFYYNFTLNWKPIRGYPCV